MVASLTKHRCVLVRATVELLKLTPIVLGMSLHTIIARYDGHTQASGKDYEKIPQAQAKAKEIATKTLSS